MGGLYERARIIRHFPPQRATGVTNRCTQDMKLVRWPAKQSGWGTPHEQRAPRWDAASEAAQLVARAPRMLTHARCARCRTVA